MDQTRRNILFALLLTVVGLTGCNTTEGIGRDIEATGQAIEDAADDDGR